MPEYYAVCQISFGEVKAARRKLEGLIAAEGLSIAVIRELDVFEKIVADCVQTILVGQTPYKP